MVAGYMEQSVFKIGEVSARLGLVDKNSNTLRGWTEEFKEFLSGSANPAPGLPRRYTAHDMQVLSVVRDYRANHLSYEEIRDRLRAGVHEVSEPAPDPDEMPRPDEHTFVGGGQALVPLAQVETLLAPLAASADEWRRLAEEYRTRLEAREERIETLERRMEDLYARLDSASRADNGPLTARLSRILPRPSVRRPCPTARYRVPRSAQANGADLRSAVSDVAPSLFPLPHVERVPRPAAESDDEAPRRRWWRVWR